MSTSDGKRIILIVDDVELNRAIISEVFKNEYAILEAENGAQAIELLEQHLTSVSIVLLDIIMPVMDGFEVLQIMNDRGWKSQLPVVMITTDTSEESTHKGYELGASDIISKPFNPKLVRQRVNNIVELYSHKSNLEALVHEQMSTLRERAAKLHESSVNMIDMLSNVIEYKNADTSPKVINIRKITKAILLELVKVNSKYSFTSNQIDQISDGAALHDIGKVAVPDAILNKRGKLTDSELIEAQKHAERGAQLIKQITSSKKRDYFKYCYEICLYHHERYDGKGYPKGISGDDIPIWAQVVSIADVYEALVSNRIYREAYPHSQAVAMIKNGECGIFNPDILRAFLIAEKKFNKEFPELSKKDIFNYQGKNNNIANANLENDLSENNNVASDRILWLLEMERQKYQILSEMSGDIIFECNTVTNKVTFTEKIEELTGAKIIDEDADSVIDTSLALFDEDRAELHKLFDNLSPDAANFKTEIRIILKNGTYRWYQMYVHSIWDMDNGKVIGSIIGKLVNIDRQKRETEVWRKAADTDLLTHLLNAAAVKSRIADIIESTDPTQSVLCFVDLDNFKGINDNFGHQFGDEVIKKIASELKNAVRLTDIVGRIGGDEFVLFLRGIGSMENIESKVSQLVKILRLDYGECKISGSIGIAKYPEDATDYETLLYKADKALYFLKTDGKDGYVFYDSKFDDPNYCTKLTNTRSKR